MSRIKWNVAANYFGRVWLGLINLLCMPLYAKIMGVESFGLVGFFGVLQSSFLIIQIGLYTTLNRELAMPAKMDNGDQSARDAVRTLEVIYWAMTIAITFVVYLISPYIAVHWLRADQLSVSTLENAIKLMALAMGLEGPYALYFGGLMGLQRQVLVNIISSVFITLRCFGALAVLWGISPTIEAYFIWQIPVSAGKTFVTAFFLHRHMPGRGKRARFDTNQLKRLWKFCIEVSGVALLTLLLTQGDKIVLSKLLSLEAFGYYNLAWLLGFSLVGLLVDPIKDASFPSFSQMAETRDTNGITYLYHLSCQAASVVLAPVSLVVAFFAHEILLTWTGNPIIAEKTSLILVLLIIGMAVRGLTTLPTAVQFAFGWTRLSIWMNVPAVMLFMPLIMVLSTSYGPEGAASAWIIVYTAYVFFGTSLMHRRILKGEQTAWYINDVGLPFLAALVVVYLCRITAPLKMSPAGTLGYLTVVMMLAMASACCAAPEIRRLIRQHVLSAWQFVTSKQS